MAIPKAFVSRGFKKITSYTRTAPGTWTGPTTEYDPATNPPTTPSGYSLGFPDNVIGFSAGSIKPSLAGKDGILLGIENHSYDPIASTHGTPLNYSLVDNSTPPLAIDVTGGADCTPYFNAPQGCFWFSGAWWVITAAMPKPTNVQNYNLRAYKSTDNRVSWHEQDAAHSPVVVGDSGNNTTLAPVVGTFAARWDGSSNLIRCAYESSQGIFTLIEFDMTAGTGAWTTAHDPIQLASTTPTNVPPYVVTNATNTTPIIITVSPAYAGSSGDTVSVEGVGGNLGANGDFVATFSTATTLTLVGSAGTGTFSSQGAMQKLPLPDNNTRACLNYGMSVLSANSASSLVRPGPPGGDWSVTRPMASSTGIVLDPSGNLYLIYNLFTLTQAFASTFTFKAYSSVCYRVFSGGVWSDPTVLSYRRGGIAIVNATNTTPIVLTLAAPYPGSSGDSVKVQDVSGLTAANGTFTISFTNPSVVTLVGSAGNAAYHSGGLLSASSGTNEFAATVDNVAIDAAGRVHVFYSTSDKTSFPNPGIGLFYQQISGGALGAFSQIPISGVGSTVAALNTNGVGNPIVDDSGGQIFIPLMDGTGGAPYVFIGAPLSNPSWSHEYVDASANTTTSHFLGWAASQAAKNFSGIGKLAGVTQQGSTGNYAA